MLHCFKVNAWFGSGTRWGSDPECMDGIALKGVAYGESLDESWEGRLEEIVVCFEFFVGTKSVEEGIKGKIGGGPDLFYVAPLRGNGKSDGRIEDQTGLKTEFGKVPGMVVHIVNLV